MNESPYQPEDTSMSEPHRAIPDQTRFPTEAVRSSLVDIFYHYFSTPVGPPLTPDQVRNGEVELYLVLMMELGQLL